MHEKASCEGNLVRYTWNEMRKAKLGGKRNCLSKTVETELLANPIRSYESGMAPQSCPNGGQTLNSHRTLSETVLSIGGQFPVMQATLNAFSAATYSRN